MTTALDDPAVVDYLSTLDRLLQGAPDRALVLDGVRQHIRDALSTGPTDPARIRAVLDELGDPAVIAAESVDQGGPAAPFLERRSGAITTVLLIAVGGLVVPVAGWVAGLVLLWLSRGWTLVDKLAGTFGPFVIALAVLAAGLLLPEPIRAGHLALIVGLVVGMIATAILLVRRFRPRI